MSGDRAALQGLTVRDAVAADLDVIVEFNRLLALETEDKRLEPDVLALGVAAALADPQRLRYWVAEVQTDDGPRIVGQTAITREWSDWRNGWIWWLQSVYVHADFRALGIFKALFLHLRAEALATPDVIGVRLYVENANHRAQRTYEALGMKPGGYSVLEELWIHGARPER